MQQDSSEDISNPKAKSPKSVRTKKIRKRSEVLLASLPATTLRAKRKNFQIFPVGQAYADGFGPDPKLINFLQKPIPIKAVGVASILLAACLVTMVSLSIPPARINQAVAIKTSTVKQLTPTVAGGKPVQWSVLIKKSDITNSNYLAVLPKSAGKIKITTVTASEASDILKTQTQQLSLKQKSQLALSGQPKSFFAASLLDSIFKYLAAYLGGASQTFADAVDPNIQQTSDGTAVDLSSQTQPAEASEPSVSNGSSSPEATTEQSQVVPQAPAEPETTQSPSAQGVVNLSPSQNDTTALDADIASAQTLVLHATVGIGPEDYTQPAVDALQSVIDSALTVENLVDVTQQGIDGAEQSLQAAVLTFKDSNQYVKVGYQTPAPDITEQNTDTGKIVTVSSTSEDPDHPVVDVLASTKIPKIFKVGQESKIHIKWKNNGDQNISFQAYDTDNDNYLDYVEWTVPHLSDQTFEIIFISKAFGF